MGRPACADGPAVDSIVSQPGVGHSTCRFVAQGPKYTNPQDHGESRDQSATSASGRTCTGRVRAVLLRLRPQTNKHTDYIVQSYSPQPSPKYFTAVQASLKPRGPAKAPPSPLHISHFTEPTLAIAVPLRGHTCNETVTRSYAAVNQTFLLRWPPIRKGLYGCTHEHMSNDEYNVSHLLMSMSTAQAMYS